MIKLTTERYAEQIKRWPQSGRYILAQYDDNSIVVYQAYRPAIGRYAATHQQFGGEFSYTRMSWVKPNFLWMMYRSGWGTKAGQEITLAVRIQRTFFDRILELAVVSNYRASHQYQSEAEWKTALKQSRGRLQWDPDHSPTGAKMERKALQLGLRGSVLKQYGSDAIIEIEDISDFVAQQKAHANGDFSNLITPRESVYVPKNVSASENICLET